jgi:hypothetical protein
MDSAVCSTGTVQLFYHDLRENVQIFYAVPVFFEWTASPSFLFISLFAAFWLSYFFPIGTPVSNLFIYFSAPQLALFAFYHVSI